MIEILDLVCFCCRQHACENYTMYKGYLICEYCLDDWMNSETYKTNEKLIGFEDWCKRKKILLDKEIKGEEKK